MKSQSSALNLFGTHQIQLLIFEQICMRTGAHDYRCYFPESNMTHLHSVRWNLISTLYERSHKIYALELAWELFMNAKMKPKMNFYNRNSSIQSGMNNKEHTKNNNRAETKKNYWCEYTLKKSICCWKTHCYNCECHFHCAQTEMVFPFNPSSSTVNVGPQKTTE